MLGSKDDDAVAVESAQFQIAKKTTETPPIPRALLLRYWRLLQVHWRDLLVNHSALLFTLGFVRKEKYRI